MRLPKDYSDNRGFSLIEIVVVMGILAILGSLGLFVAIDQYRSYALSAETSTIVSLLQKARNQAINNLGQSRHGVFLDNTNYTLFEGTDYASRVQGYDEIIPKSPAVTMGGLQEIIFKQLNGESSTIGNITISNPQKTSVISINSEGRIDW